MKRCFALILAVISVLAFSACSNKGSVQYDLGNSDRAGYFNDQYSKLIGEYGEATYEDGKLSGIAVVRLLDFTGDGEYEIYIAYADGTKDYVNRHKVVGFDNGPATIYDEEITSKAKATDEGYSIWLYVDGTGRAFIVTGDAMEESADYSTFIQTRGDEKIYAFQREFTIGGASGDEVVIDGTYEKISLSDLTQEDIDEIFAENQKVLDSINGQS